MKNYLIAYDIYDSKRAYKVRKLICEYALGGQKSAFEVILNKRELRGLRAKLCSIIQERDSINIVEVSDSVIMLGRADRLIYNDGVVIV